MNSQFLTIALCLLMANFVVYSQPEDPLNPDWGGYHSTSEAHELLQGWNKAFPNLTELYSIGETLKGTPLMVLEITNKETGAAGDKPAYYYDGSIHAGELTAAEVALHFAWHLLSNYQHNLRIRRLLDTRTLYIRPKFNPDGADLALLTPTILRSTPRPYDEDRDGLLDEDPGNDLNDDGIITQMRMKSPIGEWKLDPEDSRIRIPREDGEMEGTFYYFLSEGIDDDGDGEYNEDGVGGIDMNRNFPRNWGLESEQRGAGPYPLSEPETRATIEFINSHRNITGVFHGHTSGGFVYRLPSTTAWDNFNMEDQNLIVELSNKYNETTGQPVRPSYSNPRVHRHGTLISWSYWDFGVVAFVPEFWGGFGRDYDGNGRVSDRERHRWNSEELNGAGFVDWQPFDHPDLGEVEIGGWDTKFTRQNPPPHLLKQEIEMYVPWMLWLAEISPRIVQRSDYKWIEEGKVAKINVSIENEGYLSTNITKRAIDVDVAVPVRAKLELENAELVAGRARQDLGHLKGLRDGSASGVDRRAVVEYVVRVTGSNPQARIVVQSEKGGTQTKTLILK